MFPVSYTHLACSDCRIVDQKGVDVCRVTARRQGNVISFESNADMKGLTILLHGLEAKSVQTRCV